MCWVFVPSWVKLSSVMADASAPREQRQGLGLKGCDM